MAHDLETPDAQVNEIAGEAAGLIVHLCEGDRAAQLSAAMGCLMWITREHGMRDQDIVNLLAEMYAHNPRVPHA